MARVRMLKPGFFTNEILCKLDPLARILFAGLWTIADREGRLEDRPERIRRELLGYDDNADADELLSSLDTTGFVHRYAVEGVRFIQICAWSKHQHPHRRELKSDIPPCDDGCANHEKHDQGQAQARSRTGTGQAQDRSRSGQGPASTGTGPAVYGLRNTDYGIRNKSNGETPPLPKSGELTAAEVSTAIRQWERERGKAARGVTASQAQVIALAEMQVTADELRRAYVAAVDDRNATGDITAVNAGFIAAFVSKLRRPAREDNAWKRSPSGIERKASELGVVCPPGRDHEWLREKCESVLRQRTEVQGVHA